MLRIIAGRAKGVRLEAPKRADVRPTTDHLREAIFSTITSRVGDLDADASAQLAGLSFCDLFAGTGAMGLEAASRGASPVVLVESDAQAADLIARNIARTRLEDATRPHRTTVRHYLDSYTVRQFDLVWADPPYELANAELTRLLEILTSRGFLAPAGLVIVERPTGTPPFAWPAMLDDRWQRRYGQTTVYFAQAA